MSSQQSSAQVLSSLSSSCEVLYPSRGRVAESGYSGKMEFRVRDSGPVGPDAIWGHYNNYRSNGLLGSVIVHAVLIALIVGLTTLGPKVVPQIIPHETVTLIAPSPETYALPVARKIASGGGGGGEHDKLQAPKGRLPKVALQQITPPSIVVRNEQPELAVEPTVVV